MFRMIVITALLCVSYCAAFAGAADSPLPEVEPVDLEALSLDDFTDGELPLIYHLYHLHRVANAIVESGPDRGFIALPVWRPQQHNQPYNARVMENITSLAFFYTTDRPWNLYYADPALRARLEAALEFWTRIPHEDGPFSEYGPERWNLAATGFSTLFMTSTLHYLADGPPIDPDLHGRVVRTVHRALDYAFRSEWFYSHGSMFANQYGTLFASTPAFLELHPDPELEALLEERLRSSLDDLQSPAGYFYEANGPDFNYDINTHMGNMNKSYRHLRGGPLAEVLEAKHRLWTEWIAYNAVLEPDGAQFTLNRAIETRQSRDAFRRINTPLAETVELARAFASTPEETERSRRNRRARVERDWPEVAPLQVGSQTAYSPHRFLHRYGDGPAHFYPTEARRQQARAELPYLRQPQFVHQRVDRQRRPMTLTYVRQPGYYAAFNAGGRDEPGARRMGLGLLWNPATGTVLQSQSRATSTAWGTRPAESDDLYEATGLLEARFTLDGEVWKPEPGNSDLPGQDLAVEYNLSERGEKTVLFRPGRIEVRVRHEGTFIEHLPLLMRTDDRLEVETDRIILERDGHRLTINIEGARRAERIETDRRSGVFGIAPIHLHAEERLDYTFELEE